MGIRLDHREIERDLAKQRQGTRTDLVEPSVTLSSNEPEVSRARDIVAKKIGVSPTTLDH